MVIALSNHNQQLPRPRWCPSCKDLSNFCLSSSETCSCCLLLRSSWLRDAWQRTCEHLDGSFMGIHGWNMGETSGFKGYIHWFICLWSICACGNRWYVYIYIYCIYIYTLLYNTPTKIWPAISAQCWSQPQLHVKNSIGPGSSGSIYLTAKLPPCCIDVRWCKMFHHVEPASRGMSFQLALKLRSLLLMQSWTHHDAWLSRQDLPIHPEITNQLQPSRSFRWWFRFQGHYPHVTVID